MKLFLFELKEGLFISLRAIRANKIRSVLTTLGIIIGVTSVVLMSTAIKGIDDAFQTGVSSLGSDNLYIDKWEWFNNDVPFWELRNRKNLTMDHFEKFKELAKLPLAVSPTIFTPITIKHEEKTVEFVFVVGTTHDYTFTNSINFAEGRFMNELESNGGRSVIVLGSEIAKKLFPNGNGLGNDVRLKGKKYKVIGILEEQGSWVMGNFNPDNQAFVPIESVFKYFQEEFWNSITINVRAPNSQMIDQVKDESIEIMRKIRSLKYDQRNDFSVNQQSGLLNEINSTVGVIQIAGLLITGLALFVGAIGIMNIMFVSVKERTREIGVRKAIGAKNRTILGQFITEAAIICLIGGMIGLGIAVIGGMIIKQFDFPVTISIDAVILAVSISLMTGILSGFAPAYKASKMDPVDSLRYE